MPDVTPFLMFEGNAEEAMQFYVSLFGNSAIESLSRYEGGDGGTAGSVRIAEFTVNGQRLICIDSPIHHGFTFTPAWSLHVRCDTESEVDKLFAALSEGGQVLMPLGEYPFSTRYAWVNDRFGVSWQLMLAPR